MQDPQHTDETAADTAAAAADDDDYGGDVPTTDSRSRAPTDADPLLAEVEQ
jgi:hypothetical protein